MQRKGFGPRMTRAVIGMMRLRTIRIRTAYGLTDPIVPEVGGAQGCRVTCDLSCLVLDAFMATVECAIVGSALYRRFTVRAIIWVDDLYFFPRDWADMQKCLRLAENGRVSEDHASTGRSVGSLSGTGGTRWPKTRRMHE